MCGLLCLQFLLSTFVKKFTQQIIITQLVVLRRFAAQFIGGTNNPKQVTTSFSQLAIQLGFRCKHSS